MSFSASRTSGLGVLGDEHLAAAKEYSRSAGEKYLTRGSLADGRSVLALTRDGVTNVSFLTNFAKRLLAFSSLYDPTKAFTSGGRSSPRIDPFPAPYNSCSFCISSASRVEHPKSTP